MIEVGSTIDNDTDVPLGTIARGTYGDEYIYRPDGWHQGSSAILLPQSTVQVVGTHVRRESVEEFKQRLRTVTMGHAYNSGVSRDPLRTAFEALDMPWNADYILGMWVNALDESLKSEMPEDTMFEVGFRSEFDKYGLFRWTGSRFLHLMGGLRDPGYMTLSVVAFPDGTEFGHFPEPGEDAEDLIMELKRRAWRLGVQVKADNSYCGTFEQAMGRMGISAERVAVQPTMLGDDALRVPSVESMDSMPQETIICMNRDGTGNRWHKAGDRWQFGGGGTSPSHAFVPHTATWYYIHIPGGVPEGFGTEEVAEPPAFAPHPAMSTAELDAMPIGTELATSETARVEYRKHEDGRWHTTSSEYTVNHPSSAFNAPASGWWIRSIPVSEDEPEGYVGPTVGSVVSGALCRELPDGAVVRTENNIYVRDRSTRSQHQSGTRAVGALQQAQHFTTSEATVLHVSGAMRIPVRDHREMSRMPIGTVIEEDDMIWTKQEDQSWDGENRARTEDFEVNGTLSYVSIPGAGDNFVASQRGLR